MDLGKIPDAVILVSAQKWAFTDGQGKNREGWSLTFINSKGQTCKANTSEDIASQVQTGFGRKCQLVGYLDYKQIGFGSKESDNKSSGYKLTVTGLEYVK